MSKEDDLFFSLLNLNLKRSRASFSDESKESTDTSGWVPGMSTRHLFMMNPPPPKRLKKNVKIKNVDIDEKDSRKEEQKRSQQNGNKVDEKRTGSFDGSVLVVSSHRSSPRLRRASSF